MKSPAKYPIGNFGVHISKTTPILSKTRLKRGLQCPKSLYFSLYRKELEAPIGASTQQNFDDGHEIGERARLEFPGGVLIENEPWEREEAAEATQVALTKGALVIYEASFLANGLFAQVDILKREDIKSPWQVIEVKKGSRIKEEYLEDVAIQALVLQEAKIRVSSYHIMHLNPECKFPDLNNLFVIEDIHKEIDSLLPELKERVLALRKIAEAKNEPEQNIGPHCDAPHECAFKAHCWKKFPHPSVFNLPGVGPVKGWKYIKEGKVALQDLNAEDFKGKAKQVIELTQSDKRWINFEGLVKEMREWQWPLYFLDFETLMPVIPRYAGCGPYTQVPFQFSCHVWTSLEHKLQHFEYLHLDSSDPRPELAKTLVEKIGSKGTVLAYSAGFEKRVLERLAEDVPEHAGALLSIARRLGDPLPVIREHVYDPKFYGSFSIKDVAPVLLGIDYQDLDIGDGMAAQTLAEQIICNKVSGDEARKIRESLLEYCRQDTMAIVELTKWMMKMGRSA